jgi:hypothetical protein
VTPEEALQRPEAEDQVLSRQRSTHLLDGLVAIRTEGREHRILVGVDALGPAIAAKRFRASMTLLAFARPPAADAGRTHPEPLTGGAMRHPARNSRQNPNTKIKRERFRHASRPPSRQAL